MDRTELRFRILFEYYNEMHSEPLSRENQPDKVINKMDGISIHEKNAASTWLIDSGYVNGEVSGILGSAAPLPFINRINNYGIDFVESVMDAAFTQIKDEFENVEKLSKTERIKIFAKECMNHPVTAKMCKVTFEAIVNYINNNN